MAYVFVFASRSDVLRLARQSITKTDCFVPRNDNYYNMGDIKSRDRHKYFENLILEELCGLDSG